MRSICLSLLLLALLAGCAGAALTPSAPPATAAPPASTVVSKTTQATAPPALTSTVERTATPAAPAPTLAPTADKTLAQVTLAGLGWLENYDMLLSLDFPAPVDPSDYRVTLADKDFTCEVLAQYPNRLYCRGQGARVLAETAVRVYAAGSAEPGFTKEVWIPFFTNSYSWPND